MNEDEYLVPDRDPEFLERRPGLSQDQRAELGLGALVFVVVALLVAMLAFVFHEAWPSFTHNGLGWFGGGGNPDRRSRRSSTRATYKKARLHVPCVAADLGNAPDHDRRGDDRFVASLFVAVFIVEFAPEWFKRILEPVVRLLASVPSVIFGLLGVLILVPFIGNHLITDGKPSVTPTSR